MNANFLMCVVISGFCKVNYWTNVHEICLEYQHQHLLGKNSRTYLNLKFESPSWSVIGAMFSFRLLLPLIQVVINSVGFVMSHSGKTVNYKTSRNLGPRNQNKSINVHVSFFQRKKTFKFLFCEYWCLPIGVNILVYKEMGYFVCEMLQHRCIYQCTFLIPYLFHLTTIP